MDMLLSTFDLLGEATAMLETPLLQHYRGAREVQGRLVMKKIKNAAEEITVNIRINNKSELRDFSMPGSY